MANHHGDPGVPHRQASLRSRGLRDLLFKKVRDLEVSNMRPIFSLTSEATVGEVLTGLAKERVLSCPVYKGSEVQGFVDLKDILHGFLSFCAGMGLEGMPMLQRMKVLEETGPKFSSLNLEALPGGMARDGDLVFRKAADRCTLWELINTGFLHSRNSHRARGHSPTADEPEHPVSSPRAIAYGKVVHRVGISSASGHVESIVSQTDVVRFVYKNIGHIGEMADYTVESLGWGSEMFPRQMYTARSDTPTYDVLVLMDKHNLSGVPVLDAEGRLVGNFSVSDLRGMTVDHLGVLALPVGEFLSLENGVEFMGYAIPTAGSSPYSGVPELGSASREASDTGTTGGERGRVAVDSVAGATVGEGELRQADSVGEFELQQVQLAGSGTPRRVSMGDEHPRVAALKAARSHFTEMQRRSLGCEDGQHLYFVRPGNTLRQVLSLFVKRHLHRAYVIDSLRRPVGVITQTDILKLLTAFDDSELSSPSPARHTAPAAV